MVDRTMRVCPKVRFMMESLKALGRPVDPGVCAGASAQTGRRQLEGTFRRKDSSSCVSSGWRSNRAKWRTLLSTR